MLMWFDPNVASETRTVNAATRTDLTDAATRTGIIDAATRTGIIDAATRTKLEGYYDAVPRATARVEAHGSLTLFIRNGIGLPYYGRPTLGYDKPVTTADLRALLARQHELGLPQTLEWVHETTPSLTPAANETGLSIHEHPLMVYEHPADPVDASNRSLSARVLGAEDPALPSAIAAAHLAFSEPGTAVGSIGRPELAGKAAELGLDGWLDTLTLRIRAGRTIVAAAFEDDVAVCSGQHNPLGTTTEIVGVGTLPSARRRGLAHAVTTALVTEARLRGVETIFLSAGDQDVARMYGRIGFRRIGTALIAEPREG